MPGVSEDQQGGQCEDRGGHKGCQGGKKGPDQEGPGSPGKMSDFTLRKLGALAAFVNTLECQRRGA